MKVSIRSEIYGEIVYEESFWTGKKRLTVNNVALTKISKNVFQNENGQQFTIIGNFIKGSKLNVGSDTFVLTPAVKWYEILLSVLPIILIMIWGNVVELCMIVPVVGGAIGGAISAVFSLLNLFIIKGDKKIWLKILVSVVTLCITFGVCCAIGFAILGAMA